MTLNELKYGQKAQVVALNESPYSLRIMELGLVVGKEVSFKSKAPLGDPIAYVIGDTMISMRKSEAEQVEIQLIP
jgi:ferrous iron transport protein A